MSSFRLRTKLGKLARWTFSQRVSISDQLYHLDQKLHPNYLCSVKYHTQLSTMSLH